MGFRGLSACLCVARVSSALHATSSPVLPPPLCSPLNLGGTAPFDPVWKQLSSTPLWRHSPPPLSGGPCTPLGLSTRPPPCSPSHPAMAPPWLPLRRGLNHTAPSCLARTAPACVAVPGPWPSGHDRNARGRGPAPGPPALLPPHVPPCGLLLSVTPLPTVRAGVTGGGMDAVLVVVWGGVAGAGEWCSGAGPPACASTTCTKSMHGTRTRRRRAPGPSGRTRPERAHRRGECGAARPRGRPLSFPRVRRRTQGGRACKRPVVVQALEGAKALTVRGASR